jgi:hypothetical protein
MVAQHGLLNRGVGMRSEMSIWLTMASFYGDPDEPAAAGPFAAAGIGQTKRQ